jgi:hypothetical protein
VSDIIRMAQAMYGDKLGRMMADAGDIKAEYIAGGGDPNDVYSPERLAALQHGGPMALMRSEQQTRADGSVAAPYVPTELALATNMIEPGAVPAVTSAMNDGITTVSSGMDKQTGKGFAIGRNRDGQIVKVLK